MTGEKRETFPKELEEVVEFEGQFAITVENGVVVEIGKTFLLHPKIQFKKTGGIHWLEEKKIYKNEDRKCECWKCELQDTCVYRNKYQRLPRSTPGALGLCKKLN